ncbi:MAG: diaminopimelate decarboxylase [Fidelibacterota bacterium]|nr:MAG: diaminopimelate decarboxylase [Candidatus Neomarinimicrobiota bacterium]
MGRPYSHSPSRCLLSFKPERGRSPLSSWSHPLKSRSLNDKLLQELAGQYGTPLYVYHTDIIRNRVEHLRGFDVIRYALKANTNLSLLKWIHSLGVKVDAVSAGEVYKAFKAGFVEDEIAFTTDLFDHPGLELLEHHDIHVNLGSPDMIEQYAAIRPGHDVTLRINPGFGHGHHRKVNTGGPDSKHGIWHEQLPSILKRTGDAGLKVTGIHMHIGSGSDFKHLSRVRAALSAAARIAADSVTTISTGGGLPIPYRPDEIPFDVEHFTNDWQETRTELQRTLGRSLVMEVEPGRYLVAEAGLLLTEVRGTKTSGNVDYILVDAGFDNLIRPAMYGAYHHISIVGRDDQPTRPQVVAGPLCESADVFTQGQGGVVEPRELPTARVGDLLCIHDVGAYAASMASNYNTRPVAAEVLVEGDAARLVRRRQTPDDLAAQEVELLE